MSKGDEREMVSLDFLTFDDLQDFTILVVDRTLEYALWESWVSATQAWVYAIAPGDTLVLRSRLGVIAKRFESLLEE